MKYHVLDKIRPSGLVQKNSLDLGESEWFKILFIEDESDDYDYIISLIIHFPYDKTYMLFIGGDLWELYEKDDTGYLSWNHPDKTGRVEDLHYREEYLGKINYIF